MAYLFDTDAISELLRPRPLSIYVAWLITIPREEQYTSAVDIIPDIPDLLLSATSYEL